MVNYSSLSSCLNVKPGITCFVGGGGKTSCMFRAAEELSKDCRVLITTTTHIYEPENIPVVYGNSLPDVQLAFDHSNIVCAGDPADNGKLKYSGIPFQRLNDICDYVFVEADGSKKKPIKAPATFEPVIPVETSHVIGIIGADALGKEIRNIAFRYEIFAKLVNKDIIDPVDTNDLKVLIESENGLRKNVLPGMRYSAVINKVDNTETRQKLVDFCNELDPEFLESISLVSIWKENYSNVSFRKGCR